jgi:hypothetical protein
MATSEEAVAKMREICLALPDTREGTHSRKVAFYVGGKLFATCGRERGGFEIGFGLEPDHAAALVANDARFKPYPRDKRAVLVDVTNVKDWREMKEFLLESYELQKPRNKPAKKPSKTKSPRKPR